MLKSLDIQIQTAFKAWIQHLIQPANYKPTHIYTICLSYELV